MIVVTPFVSEADEYQDAAEQGPFVVRFVPAQDDDVISAHDAEAGVVFVRDDATPREIGQAILAVAEHHSESDEYGSIIPFPRQRKPADDAKEDRRGLG